MMAGRKRADTTTGRGRRGKIAAAVNDLRNRAINWLLVEKPAVAARIIRTLMSSRKQEVSRKHEVRPTPAKRMSPLTRDNGLRAANIAAGVPGAK